MSLESPNVQPPTDTTREYRGPIGRARDEADRLALDVVTGLLRQREEALATARESLLQEETQRLRRARTRARHRILRARKRILDRILAHARAELVRVSRTPVGERAVHALLERTLASARGPTRVRVTPTLVPGLTALVTAHPSVVMVPDPSVVGGALVETGSPVTRLDATLPGLLEALRPRLAAEVAARLDAELGVKELQVELR